MGRRTATREAIRGLPQNPHPPLKIILRTRKIPRILIQVRQMQQMIPRMSPLSHRIRPRHPFRTLNIPWILIPVRQMKQITPQISPLLHRTRPWYLFLTRKIPRFLPVRQKSRHRKGIIRQVVLLSNRTMPRQLYREQIIPPKITPRRYWSRLSLPFSRTRTGPPEWRDSLYRMQVI